ncbi:MAG: SUMF1/EgtB/PvdO family nonheme iron enzyme, partial [Anaerolineae bacterium]
TEAEWEVAARGPDGLLYPWGDDRELVNLPANEPYASGTIPVNRSAFNVYDMAGNVWEWVDEPYTAVPAGQQVLRGGAYDNQRDLAYRLAGDPTIPTMRVTAGFRCAASEVEIVPEADILLQEEFIDPESGWQTKDDGSVLFGYHQPDFYHVQAGDADTLSTSFFGGNFDNITMEALVFVDATDTETGDFRYGLVLRQNGDSYYAFTISPRAGQWYVLKNTTAGLDVLTQGSIDSLQGLTGKDRLRVDAGGSDFAFSINGRLVSQFNDADLPEGDIGFLVQTFDETRAHVHYDTLTVRRVAYAPTTTVLLSDNFTDPNSGWPTVTEGATLSGYHQPDFYHVQSGEPAHRSTAFFERDFDNFTVETEIFVDSTDTPDGDFRYGLAVRRQGNNYYAFLVSPQTGEWRVIKNSDAGEELLAAGNEASAQGVTAVNHLRVDADGPNLIFHANGRPLILVNDDSYSQGDIGFIVETVDQSRAHVHYDTFTVRQVDADLTAAPSTASVAANPTAAPTAAPTPEPTVVPTPEPSIPTAAGMVLVDGGTYDVGENTAVALDPFWIDQVEVTNAQFAAFLEATGQTSSAPAAEDDHPVRGVTWDEAAAYCQWADKRLPTEAEWVAAARGPHAWLYPWGDDETAVILPDSGAYPVGSIPANRSTFGAYDMAGNVWEWVGEPFLPTIAGQRVLRGGANSFQQDLTQRLPGDPTSSVMTTDAGFRCAAGEVEAAGEDTSQLLHDEFANLESGWWQARAPVDAYFYGYHPSDFYHVQVSADNDCLSVNHDLTADNFMAEVQVFTAGADTETGDYRYGLTIRQSDKAFYAFTVSPRSQTWQIYKSAADGLGLMAEGESDSIRGETVETRDRLFVIANGPEMIFFVNGALVSRVVDDAYVDGRFGFIVDTLDETYAHIHFDSVAIWELPSPLTEPENVENTAVAPATEPLCRGSVVAGDTLVNFISHTVLAGESLNSIAEQYNITPEEIMGANGKSIIDPNLIRPGQKLIIPRT